MGWFSRSKSRRGGGRGVPTLAAATTITVPSDSDHFDLTGTATVTSLLADPSTAGRICTFYQSDSGTTTLTNTNNGTTRGVMDLGGSNLALAATDAVTLRLLANGTWVSYGAANN